MKSCILNIPFTICMVIFISSTEAAGSESPEYFVNAHDCSLSRIIEARLVDEFGFTGPVDIALARLTDYAVLDEFDKRSKREAYQEELEKVWKTDVEFSKNIKGYILEGWINIGDYDFQNGYFPVNRMRLDGGFWSIDRGDLKAPAYSYVPEVKFCVDPGGDYINLDRDFYYQFDWNLTELNLDFGSDEKAKAFLDSFGKEAAFTTISTIDEIAQGKDYIGYFFNVQCFLIMGNTVSDVRIFSVKGRDTALCEEFLRKARLTGADAITDIPETWDPKRNNIDMSIMSYVFRAKWE